MALVSDSRSNVKRLQINGQAQKPAGHPRRAPRLLFTVLGILGIAVVAAIAVGVLAVTAKPGLAEDSVALAHVALPFGSGAIEHVSVVGGREQKAIPVYVRDGEIWPTHLLGVHERVIVEVAVKRPSWISWLSGSTEHLRLSLLTPSAGLRSPYVTVRPGQPLAVAFTQAVRVFGVGSTPALARHVLATPQNMINVQARGTAGTLYVAGAPRAWESPTPALLSWFPAGAAATAVAYPAPGARIGPQEPITLTFSKPVDQALGNNLPPVSPDTPGIWHSVNSHTIVFRPQGYGYGLGAKVTVALPAGIQLVGGQNGASDPTGSWSVPAGSTLRLQQLLATLGYLPVSFAQSGAAVGDSLQAQEAAAIKPPDGTFNWRYSSTPAALVSMWQAGTFGEMTKGAIMAFENDHGMTTDGLAGPSVWKALIAAVIAGDKSSFGYTFVYVSEGSPESINVWHDGKTVVTGPVNTGISVAPTAQGVFAVYEHLTVTTMSGLNPDGTPYSDPGIPWVSYFNGGDALHGFIRASYGFPQSLGCVEMPYSQAGAVYPYTPIGTLVDVG
ncbi:MAG: L,D-transpeptidase family protein [Solirubrobacteraceae bacterium]